MRALALLVLLASCLAGCSNFAVALNSSGTAAAGTTAVGGATTAAGSGAAGLALFALAVYAFYGTETTDGMTTTYRANPFDAIGDGSASRQAPDMDGSRRVHEQDCTKPIKDWSANLKCR